MASLKNEWSIRFIILLVGLGLGFKLFNKPEKPAQVVEQNQSQDCKAQVVRITKPDGTKEERIEIAAGQSQSQKTPVQNEAKKDNLFISSDIYEHGIYYRPDGLPVHIGVEYNRNTNEIKAKAGLSLRFDF